MRFSKELIPVALILAALIAVNLLYKRSKPSRSSQRVHVDYTSYSAEEQGAKAFYLLLERLGYRSRRLRTSYHEMQEGLAVVIAPDQPIDEMDVARLLEWVRQGNTLILVPDGREDRLTGALRITLRQRQLRRRSIAPSASTDLTAGIQELTVLSGNRIRTGRQEP